MNTLDCKTETRVISIAQWHALAQEGVAPPITIPLDGDSMRPLIRRGRDKVTIVPLSHPLKPGDVVLFEAPPGRYVVHRVYHLKNGFVQTLGDHCINPDIWMPEAQVLGQAVQVARGSLRISLDNSPARCFGIFWMALLPVRRIYCRTRHTGGKILRTLGLRR